MGWVYMATCTADFVIFPVLWSLLQAMSKGQVTNQWQPLTLQGAGLYHIAMGAVLGIAAYGRTKEKLKYLQEITALANSILLVILYVIDLFELEIFTINKLRV